MLDRREGGRALRRVVRRWGREDEDEVEVEPCTTGRDERVVRYMLLGVFVLWWGGMYYGKLIDDRLAIE